MKKLFILLTAGQVFATSQASNLGAATTPGSGTTRYYAPNGVYQGSATTAGNTTRYWGKSGQYQGSSQTGANDHAYYYNQNGDFKGTGGQ